MLSGKRRILLVTMWYAICERWVNRPWLLTCHDAGVSYFPIIYLGETMMVSPFVDRV